jgi:aryl-alcohol dehydrogenase-like predicted oxidoreductase
MRYRQFGSTGLFVSELCLGTMTFGGSESDIWGQIGRLQQNDVDGVVKRALDAGINFIDTANVYGQGQSEVLTGHALKHLGIARDNVVVATKVFGEMSKGPNGRGLSRYHVLEAAKASLKRLQLEHVDLYQVHGFDAVTPMEEALRALDTLVQQGCVRYIGVSNWAAWQIVKALGISERLGLARFASLQAYYTIAGRDLERELVPMLRSEGLGLLVWSPLAGGLLSGKYSRAGSTEPGSRRTTFDFPPVQLDRAWDVIDVMRGIADTKGVSVAQIALAWLLHQPVVTSVIVGAKRIDQLDDNIAAASVQLSAEELAALNTASELPVEYPGWMIARQGETRRAQLERSMR